MVSKLEVKVLRVTLPSAVSCNYSPLLQRGWGRVCSSHATGCSEGGCDCSQHSDQDVEDLAPERVVVEGSHSGKKKS